MVMKNRYSKSSKLSEGQIRSVVQCLAADLTAVQTAQICGLKRNTVNRIYRGLRERIFVHCEMRRPFFGIVDVAESFFGARRVKGNRGRGSHGKTVVFGIFERAGKVYRLSRILCPGVVALGYRPINGIMIQE